MKWHRLLGGFLLVGIGLYGLGSSGCGSYYYNGSCGDDEDLQNPENFYDGAVCVDGQAACPGGNDFCWSIQEVAGRSRNVLSCDGPCIECPRDRGACVFFNENTITYSYHCVETSADCWGRGDFFPVGTFNEKCAAMGPGCL